MVHGTLLPDDAERHVILGPKLKLELHRESRRVVAEWKRTTEPHRRAELARQALLIFDLLDIRIGTENDDATA